ncbi:SufE family protein [Hwanghaeella grinnelliae]|uniref:SufE family protein n=1 Tax=Hwanghaeella grinnelliae TaxID=2500179 RepID=A0A437QUZ3_9PROT|nr:SufE family protein [Hwanghaeella grinnelliae]RVU38325.1 SufE family protein [Hwanghaeella grinnelliae]
MTMTVDELVESFEFFDDWEDRYAYVIDLGKKLPPMPESEMVEENKVRGCMSQVWLVCEKDVAAAPPVLRFRANSDAFIVKGLIAILLELYDGQTPAFILETDALDVMGRIGLDQHLSPNRRNGLVAMVERIKKIAAEAN